MAKDFLYTIRINFDLQCSVCGTRAPRREVSVASSAVIPEPQLPVGWNVLNQALICDKHIVTVTDKPTARVASKRGK